MSPPKSLGIGRETHEDSVLCFSKSCGFYTEAQSRSFGGKKNKWYLHITVAGSRAHDRGNKCLYSIELLRTNLDWETERNHRSSSCSITSKKREKKKSELQRIFFSSSSLPPSLHFSVVVGSLVSQLWSHFSRNTTSLLSIPHLFCPNCPTFLARHRQLLFLRQYKLKRKTNIQESCSFASKLDLKNRPFLSQKRREGRISRKETSDKKHVLSTDSTVKTASSHRMKNEGLKECHLHAM